MNLTDFQFHGIGHLKRDLTWGMNSHGHPFHEIIVVLQGTIAVRFSDATVRGTAGDVLFYRAGAMHEESAAPPAPLETFFLAFFCSDPLDDIPRMAHDTGGRLRVLANWLYQDRDLPEPLGTEAIKNGVQMILSEYKRLLSGRQDNLVLRTRQFVRSRIAELLTLDELAAHAHMSKYHFARRYHELSGRTPADDVRIMRVEYARNLLLTSDMPLKSIAPMAGLGDVYHLSRMFRKYLNMTPSEVRSHRPMQLDEE